MPSTITDRLNGLTTSVAVKPPCVVVATANITLAGLQTIDSVVLAEDDRVLVIGQTDTSENGIYNADSGDWTRARDFDGDLDAVQGTLVLVTSASGVAAIYELTSPDPITIGTSALTFELRYGANARYDRTAAEISVGAVIVDDSIPHHEAVGFVTVERYGTPTSTTFNTAMAVASAAGAIPVQFTDSFTAASQLSYVANVLLRGAGRRTSIITKGFNGDLFAAFPAGATIMDLGLDGNGANFTGRLLPITGAAGNQAAYRCDITNAESFCIDFETNAGSKSIFVDCLISRYLGTTSDAFCSVRIADVQQLSAKPRKFVSCETDGTFFIDFGGSNNTHVEGGGFTGGFKFSDESRAVFLTGIRWGNQPTCTVRGHQVAIVGCDINPDLTLEGSGPILIDSALNGTITDNCTAGSSVVIAPSTSYTPTWTAVTVDPAIGNGTLRGEVARIGNAIKVSIELVIGSTTSLGTGGWRFTIPKAPSLTSGTVQVGMGVAVGASYVLLAARLLNAGTFIELFVPGSLTQVGPAAPFAWATGNSLRIDFSYNL